MGLSGPASELETMALCVVTVVCVGVRLCGSDSPPVQPGAKKGEAQAPTTGSALVPGILMTPMTAAG